MDCVLSRFQSTELDLLCKWESFKNQQCLKYLFDPTYTKSFSASVMSMFTRLISSCSKKYSTAFLLMLKKMQSWSLAIHSKALSRSFRIVGKKTWVSRRQSSHWSSDLGLVKWHFVCTSFTVTSMWQPPDTWIEKHIVSEIQNLHYPKHLPPPWVTSSHHDFHQNISICVRLLF